MIENTLNSIEACAQHYGDDVDAMRDYLGKVEFLMSKI